ncbi:MAG: hypothetical protein ABH872_04285 [Candidatus Omnitrophota bacterium]
MKNSSETRGQKEIGAVGAGPARPFTRSTVIIFTGSFAFFALLPKIFYLKYFHPLYDYKLMWLNFIGNDYKLGLETPKPLLVLFAGIISPKLFYIFACLFCAVLVICLCELSKLYTGGCICGLGASFLCFFANYEMLPDTLFPVLWPIFYTPLLLLCILCFLKKRFILSFSFLFCASLLRPEAWLYLMLFFFWHLLIKTKRRFIFLFFLSAPLLWSLFDYAISGDFLLSYNITAAHPAISNLQTTTFLTFWPKVLKMVFVFHSMPALIVGMVSMFFCLLQQDKEKLLSFKNAPVYMCLAPFVFYWLFSLKNDLFVYSRFFTFSICIIYLFAAFFPFIIFKKHKHLAVAGLCLILLVSAKYDVLNLAIKKRRIDEIRTEIFIEMGNFIKSYQKRGSINGPVIIGSDMGYFSFELGEDFSKKCFFLRKVALSPEVLKGEDPYFLLYYPFNNLQKYSFDKFRKTNNYKLTPVFVSRNKEAVIYRITRNRRDSL